jgi:hypothetical protein
MNSKSVLIKFGKAVILFSFIIAVSCAHSPQQPKVSFDELTKTLITPQSIYEYQKKNFRWASGAQGGGCAGVDIGVSLEGCTPEFIYHNKGKGNCGAYTTFAVHFLRSAGYEAYPLYVYDQWPNWLAPGHEPRDYHIMTLYSDNGKWFTLDEGKPQPQGIKGPYNKIEDLPYKVLRIDKEYK